jgi:hypothetical protein
MATTAAGDGLDNFRMAVTGVMRRQRDGVQFACDEDMPRADIGRVRGTLADLAREQGWDGSRRSRRAAAGSATIARSAPAN